MIIEKNLKKDLGLELSKELLEKAHLIGKVNIIIEENEIIIKKVTGEIAILNEMVGLGKEIFGKDSVTLQKAIRAEWKL